MSAVVRRSTRRAANVAPRVRTTPTIPTGPIDSFATPTPMTAANTGSVPSSSATRAGEVCRIAQAWAKKAKTVHPSAR